MSTFVLLFFIPGPKWLDGKSVFEQPLAAHFDYIRGLHASGKALMGGPFADGDGGMVVLQVSGRAEALAIAAADPDVIAGVLSFAIREWWPVAWNEARGASAYETPPMEARRLHPPRPRPARD